MELHEVPGLIAQLILGISLEGVEKVAKYALAFGLIVVALKVLKRLPTILDILEKAKDARSPIWDLRQTADAFKNSIDTLKTVAPVVAELKEQVLLLTDKIDAAQKQVAQLQIIQLSKRQEDGGAGDDEPPPLPPTATQRSEPTSTTDESASKPVDPLKEVKNWEMLRSLWYANVERLEAIISGIQDGRRKLKYDRAPRYRYEPIIEMLRADELIDAAVAAKSIELNRLFMTHRSRKRPVSEKDVGALIVLDHQLEEAMRKSKPT